MSNYNKMVVVEGGATVFIQNSTGVSVFFNTFEECLKYTGHDFTGKFLMNYEPDNKIFSDNTNEDISDKNIPYQPYEMLIASIAEFLARKADAMYGLSASEKKTLAYTDQVNGINSRKVAENIKLFPYNGKMFVSTKDVTNDISGVLSQCQLLDDTDPIPTFPINSSLTGKWVTHDESTVTFTCGEFKLFCKEYFNRFSWNFDNRTTHLVALRAVYDNPGSTEQDILNYSFTAGWK